MKRRSRIKRFLKWAGFADILAGVFLVIAVALFIIALEYPHWKTLFHVGYSCWFVVSCWLAVIGVKRVRKQRRTQRREQGLCEECGYDLTGNVSGVCPECG